MSNKICFLGMNDDNIGVEALLGSKAGSAFYHDRTPPDVLKRRYGAELASRLISEDAVLADVRQFDLYVRAPGFARTHRIVSAAYSAGIAVRTNIEFAIERARGRIVAISGTNGKTTVAHALSSILRAAGRSHAICGNTGKSMSSALASGEDPEFWIVELSYAYLEGMVDLHADYAALTNIYPDHADRHSFPEYCRVKMRVFGEDPARIAKVLNIDDREIADAIWSRLGGHPADVTISTSSQDATFYFDGDAIYQRGVDGAFPLIRGAEVHPYMRMNASNYMIAAALAYQMAIPRKAIVTGLMSLQGVKNRCEILGTVDGVIYVNDAKATNFASGTRTLSAFAEYRKLVIVGGRSKGADLSRLRDLLGPADRIVLYGANRSLLRRALGDVIIHEAGLVEDALLAARDLAIARGFKAVLLCPFCAADPADHPSTEILGDHFSQAFAHTSYAAMEP